MDCCHGWTIYWLESEIDKLKKSEHSKQLEELINSSFVPNKDNLYKISLLPDGDCPFHDKSDGLCKIQKEIGAEYLSVVCRNYPITGTLNNNVLSKVRSLSCPAVYDLITSNEHACDVYTYAKEYEPDSIAVYRNYTVKDINEHPIFKYLNPLFDFFYGILSNKKRDIHNSLIIGTLAAQTLSKLESTNPDRIPEGIEALSKQINTPSLAASLADIKPNYAVKLGVAQCLLDGTSISERLGTILDALRRKGDDNTSNVNIDLYIKSFERFKKACGKKDYILNNVIRCLYMCQLMPFADNEYDIFANYAFFCASVAFVDFLAAAAAAGADDDKEILERFKTAVCLSAHPLCHNADRVKMVVDYLKDINFYSAGHLALIVK